MAVGPAAAEVHPATTRTAVARRARTRDADIAEPPRRDASPVVARCPQYAGGWARGFASPMPGGSYAPGSLGSGKRWP